MSRCRQLCRLMHQASLHPGWLAETADSHEKTLAVRCHCTAAQAAVHLLLMCCFLQVMEPCKTSDKIFSRSNPWVAAILALAAEIYTSDAIKLNLKFDVEMLFRHFSLQVSSGVCIHVQR